LPVPSNNFTKEGVTRSMNSKERCLAVIQGKPVDRAPVFPLLMFLAADRLGVSYRQYATDGHILAESQLKAYQTFGLDAITACSDAFRLAADLGGEMVYPEERPPYLAHPLVASAADLVRLKRPQVSRSGSRTADRAQAVQEMAQAVGNECLVLGWVDMPFAEACSLCGVSDFMLMLIDQPRLAHAVLEFITPLVIDFALLQLAAGAPMIGAGDAAASLVSARQFREFALPYEQRVCAAVHQFGGLLKLHICGKTTHLLEDMVQSGADLFNVDHLVPLEEARQVYAGAGRAYKGNLNPVTDMLYATPEACQQRALECLRIARGSSYMLSPGCEVPAAVTDEVFSAFCESVSKI
jgi:MtaA/CmuA family methyltransferase